MKLYKTFLTDSDKNIITAVFEKRKAAYLDDLDISTFKVLGLIFLWGIGTLFLCLIISGSNILGETKADFLFYPCGFLSAVYFYRLYKRKIKKLQAKEGAIFQSFIEDAIGNLTEKQIVISTILKRDKYTYESYSGTGSSSNDGQQFFVEYFGDLEANNNTNTCLMVGLEDWSVEGKQLEFHLVFLPTTCAIYFPRLYVIFQVLTFDEKIDVTSFFPLNGLFDNATLKQLTRFA
jgi:hypothetical protein